MKKLNRKSVSPSPLRRPNPAPYFHPLFFNFSDSPLPPPLIKIYSLPFKKKRGGGVPNYVNVPPLIAESNLSKTIEINISFTSRSLGKWLFDKKCFWCFGGFINHFVCKCDLLIFEIFWTYPSQPDSPLWTSASIIAEKFKQNKEMLTIYYIYFKK